MKTLLEEFMEKNGIEFVFCDDAKNAKTEIKALESLAVLKNFVLKNFDNNLDKLFIDGACDIIEKELVALDIIKQNLEYGYVFIGYGKDNKPLFQFADKKLYEEIKKNITY